jgi:DHA1 family bicyclomycin/chloramphenicol resistance-like MFS transporter
MTQSTPVLGINPRLSSLMIIAAVSPLAINVFLPSIPKLVTFFKTDYATAQLGLSLFLATMSVLQLVIGPLSDKYGRRPVLIGGLLMFLAGTIMCLSATAIEYFLLGRLVQACAVAGIVLSRAIVRDLVSREKSASAIGYVTMGMAVAPMIGPAIGGLLDEHYGWQSSFILLGVLGTIALGFVITNIPETNAGRGALMSAQIANYRLLFQARAFWLYALTGATASGVFFGFLGGAPAIASGPLGLSPSSYGLWFAITAFGYLLGNFISGRFSERQGIRRMIIQGTLIALSGCAMPFIIFPFMGVSSLALFGPMLLVGIGNGMALPSTTAAAISVRPQAAGAASGLIGALQTGFGAVLSSVCGTVVAGGTAPIAFAAVIFAVGIISVVLALLGPRSLKA